jgi:flagellar basal body rod protein FlgG
MIYGLYLSASASLTQMARQDVEANNLANVDTVAFKPDSFSIRQRDVARKEDGLFHLSSSTMLERLGGGVMPLPTRVDTSPAALRETGDPLDIAIEGHGFFGVRYGDGPDSLRLTRDGRMTLNAQGTLVRATDGSPMLGAGGGPIRLDPTLPVAIDADGTIRQAGEPVAQLMVVDAPSNALLKAGDNLLRLAGGAQTAGQLTPASGSVRQHFVETSGVDPIKAMMAVNNAANAAQSNLRMIGLFNDIMDRAINRLGRVA